MSKKSFDGILTTETSSLSVEALPVDTKPVVSATPERRKSASKAKWQGLLKVNVLLHEKQKDLLDDLARQVMRGRSKGEERITANTFLRCLTDLLKSRASSLNLADVSDEDDLRKRLSDLLTK